LKAILTALFSALETFRFCERGGTLDRGGRGLLDFMIGWRHTSIAVDFAVASIRD
jgi:hypothetical protein